MEVLLARFKESNLLEALSPGRRRRWLNPAQRTLREQVILRRFSFLDDPRETLLSLRRLIDLDCTCAEVKANFEDPGCLDAGSLIVFCLIQKNLSPVISGGKMDHSLQTVFKALDMERFANVRLFGDTASHAIWPFQITYRRKPGTSTADHQAFRATTKEKVADRLVKQVDEWLDAANTGRELTPRGKGSVSKIVTELLCNAERHSDEKYPDDGSWWIAGFMTREDPEQEPTSARCVCHLAIVSLGRSVSDSLETSRDNVTQSLMADYRRRHGAAGGRDSLLNTVCALQDGVSKDSQAPGEVRGGTGFMEVIEFVDSIGGPDNAKRPSRIAVISGSSCVIIGGPYRQVCAPRPGTPREQWFNERNSLEDPPSPDHVFMLPIEFPGTIVSMRFCLDAGVLRSVVSDDQRT